MRNHAITQQLPGIMPSTGKMLVRVPIGPVAVLVRRAADLVTDAVMLLAVILAIPFVILAVGIPIALVVQLVVWIGRHL